MGFCSCTERRRGCRDERDEEETGRKGEISEVELYQLLGSQHRHKFVLKVEKPWGGGGRCASLYEPGSLNKWGCTVAAPLFSGHSLFERINNIAFSTSILPSLFRVVFASHFFDSNHKFLRMYTRIF